MKHVLVAVPNDQELAARLGKKGSSNGITFYNRKDGESVFAILTPTDAEKKFNSVAEVLTISDNIVVSTKSIDRLFGESIIGCGLLGKQAILTADQDASSIMQKSGLHSTVVEEDRLLSYLGAQQADSSGDPIVEVDHSFDVKGVGVVLLGVVRSGVVKVHDELFCSSGKRVTIRSLQSQDQDINEAGTNTRVGIAIKGAESDEISKGDLLSRAEIRRTQRIKANISISGLVKDKDLSYSELWLVCGFRSSACKMSKEGDYFEISMAAQLAMRPGEKFLLVRKESPRIFACGTVKWLKLGEEAL